jgi:PhzF family phenazine biosynthesis protein
MPVPLTIVDSFTDRPFSGNPAGVCQLQAWPDESWLQGVAAEVNLSETAFVVPRGDGDLDLRWFTPTTEIDLCGHATPATTRVLGRSVRYHTRSGVLTTTVDADGTITMDFPAHPVEPADPNGWAAKVGVADERVLRRWASDTWNLIEVDSADAVRSAAPDMDALRAERSVIVVACGTDRFDSVCRVFAPAWGIPEDPVTGAAHCVIAPWLAALTGRTEMVGHQASQRGGTVGMRLDRDRVQLSGKATIVTEGRILVDP